MTVIGAGSYSIKSVNYNNDITVIKDNQDTDTNVSSSGINSKLDNAEAASLDFGGKKPGRGAYVCHDVACLQKARKTRALERAFDTAIPPEVYDAMEAELRGADGPA